MSEVGPLPPLAMKDPEPAPIENLKSPVETNAPPIVEMPTPGPVAPMPTMTAPMEPILTPQMFLQFFNDKNGTNRDYNVVLPYQFTPPTAPTIPAPPSRATYTVK